MSFDAFFAPTLPNAAGWVALGLLGLSFQMRRREGVGLVLAGASLMFALHYAGKGAFPGTVVALTVTGTSLAGAYAGRFPVLRLAKYVALPVLWGVSALVWTGPVDVLPALGVTLEVLGMTQRRLIVMRAGFAASQFLWVGFNLAVGSGPGLLANAIVFTSSVTGIVRHHVLPRRTRPAQGDGSGASAT